MYIIYMYRERERESTECILYIYIERERESTELAGAAVGQYTLELHVFRYIYIYI